MKRRVYYRILNLWMLFLLIWGVACNYVIASEAEEDYVVTPIAADTISGEEPYFFLTVGPSRKQVIEVEVRNNTNRSATVYTSFYTAVPRDDGTISYISPEEQTDSVEIKLSDIISGESGLTIPAGKAYVFQFTVTMSAKSLENLAAGGLVIMIAPENPEESTEPSVITEMGNQKPEGAGFLRLSTNENTQSTPEIIRQGLTSWLLEANVSASVSAEFTYVVPLFIESGENTESPNLTLMEISSADYATEIKAKIQNATSLAAENVTIEATVRKQGKKEIFYEISEENISIPAHTDYELIIPSMGKSVDIGEYTLQIKLIVGSTEWEWAKNFSINEKEDNVIENIEMDKLESNVKFNWYYIIIPVCILLTVSVIVGIFMYRKKQREEEAIIEAMRNIMKLF